ncbi:transglutaminase family protein [Paratractidigestivibacter sp.]|uniref:transglutaminase family protein n=1 Tax=Paratractidigestivibacter sp. TaxID=2847316 RepID=UPI002ABD327D|nr:transglutaminase family protein [Paratractidigestivibacter sp.]
MKILNYFFETTLEFSEPVRAHDFVLRCMPPNTGSQTVMDSQLIVEPPVRVSEQVDGFGNKLQVGRLDGPHDSFTFISSGMVMVDTAQIHAAAAHPVYSRQSELTQAGPHIKAFVDDALRVCANAPARDKAERLAGLLSQVMTYGRGNTGVKTTAEEALAGGRGVCQDYAHVLISACREAGVPARYVNGFLLGEGETHAWVEVHDGVCWRGVDPTNRREADCNYITLSHGRDFSDCPIERGVFVGQASQAQSVRAQVTDDAAWAALGTYST